MGAALKNHGSPCAEACGPSCVNDGCLVAEETCHTDDPCLTHLVVTTQEFCKCDKNSASVEQRLQTVDAYLVDDGNTYKSHSRSDLVVQLHFTQESQENVAAESSKGSRNLHAMASPSTFPAAPSIPVELITGKVPEEIQRPHVWLPGRRPKTTLNVYPEGPAPSQVFSGESMEDRARKAKLRAGSAGDDGLGDFWPSGRRRKPIQEEEEDQTDDDGDLDLRMQAMLDEAHRIEYEHEEEERRLQAEAEALEAEEEAQHHHHHKKTWHTDDPSKRNVHTHHEPDIDEHGHTKMHRWRAERGFQHHVLDVAPDPLQSKRNIQTRREYNEAFPKRNTMNDARPTSTYHIPDHVHPDAPKLWKKHLPNKPIAGDLEDEHQQAPAKPREVVF